MRKKLLVLFCFISLLGIAQKKDYFSSDTAKYIADLNLYFIDNSGSRLEAENYLRKQSGHFQDCLNILVKEHGGKWILFEDGRIIYSGITQEELEAKIRERKDSDYYRPTDFVAFVPLHVEDMQIKAPAEPKSKAVIAIAEIFRAATDREKLEIFKEICDLRIQSIGIERPEE